MDSAPCVLRLADQPHSPGAGNVSDDTGLAGASEILKEGVPNEARAGEFSSGRGGAGNIVDAQHIAKEDGSEDSDPDMRAIGSKVQAFANNKAPKADENQQPGNESKTNTAGPEQPVRKKVLGEHGHGPVVHPGGSSKIPP